MFNRFANSIRQIGHSSTFESYFAHIHRNGDYQGGPSVEEARRDYKEFLKSYTTVI